MMESESSDHMHRHHLQRAFSSSPYENYKKAILQRESEGHTLKQLQKQKAARNMAIRTAAVAGVQLANDVSQQTEHIPITPDSGKDVKRASLFSSDGKSPLQPTGDGYRLWQIYREAFLQVKQE